MDFEGLIKIIMDCYEVIRGSGKNEPERRETIKKKKTTTKPPVRVA